MGWENMFQIQSTPLSDSTGLSIRRCELLACSIALVEPPDGLVPEDDESDDESDEPPGPMTVDEEALVVAGEPFTAGAACAVMVVLLTAMAANSMTLRASNHVLGLRR